MNREKSQLSVDSYILDSIVIWQRIIALRNTNSMYWRDRNIMRLEIKKQKIITTVFVHCWWLSIIGHKCWQVTVWILWSPYEIYQVTQLSHHYQIITTVFMHWQCMRTMITRWYDQAMGCRHVNQNHNFTTT